MFNEKKSKYGGNIYLLDREWKYVLDGMTIVRMKWNWVNSTYIKTFNLQALVEKALSRINWYYEVLSNIGETETKNEWKENWMLLDVVEYDKEENIKKCLEYAKKWNNEDTLDLLTWSGNGMEEWVYRIVYDCVDDVIYYVYNDMDMKEEDKIEWKLTKE